jgi:hypothetical protein
VGKDLDIDWLDDLLIQNGLLPKWGEFFRSYKLSFLGDLFSDPDCRKVLEDILNFVRNAPDETLSKLIPTADSTEQAKDKIERFTELCRCISMDNFFQKPFRRALLLLSVLIKEIYEKYPKREVISRHIAITKFFYNLALLDTQSRLEGTEGFHTVSEPVIETAFYLGFLAGVLRGKQASLDKPWLEVYHKAGSQEHQRKAPGPERDKYDDAVKIAENLWTDEEEEMDRKEMINYLLTLTGYENLDPKKLAERLKPVAELFHKVPPRGRPRKKE